MHEITNVGEKFKQQSREFLNIISVAFEISTEISRAMNILDGKETYTRTFRIMIIFSNEIRSFIIKKHKGDFTRGN